ncbi:hypothetical protein Tco_1358383 [Tanacetum coccineum]
MPPYPPQPPWPPPPPTATPAQPHSHLPTILHSHRQPSPLSRTTSPRTIVTLHVTPPPPPLSSHHPLRPPSPHLATTTKVAGVFGYAFNSPVGAFGSAYKASPKVVFGSSFNSPYRAV